MRLLKFCLIVLLTFLIIVGIPDLINTVFFSTSPVLSQTKTERTMEADRLLNEGIEKLAKMEPHQADSILTLFQQALAIYQEENDQNGEGQVFKNLGVFYYQLQDYSQSLDYTQKALKIAQEINNLDLETRAFINQGVVYYTQKNYPLAIDSYQEGLSVLQKIDSPELESKLNHNLANAYKDSSNFSQAIAHYEKALVAAREINSLPGQYLILDSLAEVHKNLGNNRQANEYEQQAFEILGQIETNQTNNLPKQEIEGIMVPSKYSISLEGEVDGNPFNVLSGTLEILPASKGDPNPFLVALYMDKRNPEDLKIGSLFWQSYSPGHPQEKEHYSRISVNNSQVRMEINPSQGFRSDVTWFTQGLLGENLQQMQEELDQIEQQINQALEEQGLPTTERGSSYEMPNQPTFPGVTPTNGTLTFSIQNNQISGEIDASGLSGEVQPSRYQAQFRGQLIEEQAKKNNGTSSVTSEPKIEPTNPKNPLCSFFNKLLTKTTEVSVKDDLEKKKINALFSFSGIKEPQLKSLQGAWWGTENLTEMFGEANWIFLENNTFVFVPPSNADVRSDLFPLLGTYSQDNNTLKISGEQASFGAASSLDGIIQLQGEQAFLDVIYAVTSMDSQNIVRVSQSLLKGNQNITYKLPKTEVEGIKVPSTFKISLQGETNGQSFGKLSGVLRIKPNDSTNNSYPFIVTLETDFRNKNGSVSWIAQEFLSSVNSQITIDNNQVSLQLKPNSTVFSDLNWWTLPSSQSHELDNSPLIFTGTEGELTFRIQNNKISGTIKGTGNSSGWYSSSYYATFTGEVETLPPAFQGVWEEKSSGDFQEVTLEQKGEKVYGTYKGNGGGKIEGIVQGKRLDFTWKGSDQKQGKGFFRAVSNGRTLTGIWENTNSSTDTKSFLAERTKDSYRNPEIATELAKDKWYLKDLGADLVLEGRCEQALNPLKTSLNLYKQEIKNTKSNSSIIYGYLLDEANIIRNLTHCHFQLQDYESLIASLDNSLEVSKAMIEEEYLPIPTEQQAIDIRNALANNIESWRRRLTNDSDKIIALDKAQPFLQKLTAYLVELDAREEALLASETSRARAFIDLLEKQVSSSTLKTTINAKPPNIQQIKKIAKEKNTTLVEYSIIDALNSAETFLYIWLVKPTGEIAFKQVNLTQSPNNTSLSELVINSRESIGVRGRSSIMVEPLPEPDQTSNLQQLYQLLIEPIADLLPSDPNQAVIFIPQGELFLVPFPALQDQAGTYLIGKHTILTAPAIQLLDLTQKQRTNVQQANLQNKVIVGNPTMPKVTVKIGEPPEQLKPLPAAKTEAIEIAKLFNTQPLIGSQATKKNILSQLPQARIIHLATHGLLDDIQGSGVPGAIALAPSGNDNGLLTANEILDLKLNAELVVLSACDTGRGRITGDGVIGLSRSLITAGVPSVIVSLWSVPDAPTASLMTEFYRNWQEEKMDKAQALRQAMLTTMKTDRNPRNWAAFTLIGETE
ncbi:MAG: CHAT domain-containing tetratricopeptide repeat protein [Crocosphaera sp.]|nr:CHAT domain-containing tetratricopeptide repeat protein [Crocosphaera sp.]